MIKRLLLIAALVAAVLSPISAAAQSADEIQAAHDLQEMVGSPKNVIEIPGLEFGEPVVKEEQGDFYLYLPFLGDYIAALYRYGMIAGSVIAIVIIMASGIAWITSGGNVSQIGDAKKRIVGSLTGLILMFLSYTILTAINPEFTSFRNLRINYIAGVGADKYNEEVFDGDAFEDLAPHLVEKMKVVPDTQGTVLKTSQRKGLTYAFNDIPYFSQFDARWGHLRYGEKDHCSTYGKAGCGPSSFAMVLQKLGHPINPTHIGKIAAETGARICNSGTNSRNKAFLSKIKEEYTVNIEELKSPEQALSVLETGMPLIISGRSEGFGITGKRKTYKGHFMVLTGTETIQLDGGKNTQIVRVNDPGNHPHKGITYMNMEQFEKLNRFLYIYDSQP